MSLNYSELKRRYDTDGAAKTVGHLSEALEEGHLQPSDFSLRDLAEALVPDGREWVRAMHPDPRYGNALIVESDAVDSTAFSNITGQIVYSAMLKKYQNEAFIMTRLVGKTPTRLDGEKIPGMARIGDDAEIVNEAMPYPHSGFGEDYIQTPSTVKRGNIVPVTKEAIFFDRTAMVIKTAGEVGEFLGVNKEKRICDLVAGFTNNYNWLGTSYNTYQSSTPWINVKSSNELVDWTDVDAVEQLFANILDPHTGEPVVISGTVEVVVMPAKHHTANRVFNAAAIEYGATGSSSATTITHAANPLNSNYRVSVSRQMYRRIINGGEGAAKAANWWFTGDFSRAFTYMENWPITVTRSPRNSEAEFERDIVLRFKASERGVPAVLDPRYVVKSYDTTDL